MLKVVINKLELNEAYKNFDFFLEVRQKKQLSFLKFYWKHNRCVYSMLHQMTCYGFVAYAIT